MMCNPAQRRICEARLILSFVSDSVMSMIGQTGDAQAVHAASLAWLIDRVSDRLGKLSEEAKQKPPAKSRESKHDHTEKPTLEAATATG